MKNDIPNLEEQIEALAAMKDEDIDFSDIPEIRDWTGAVRGNPYRPVKNDTDKLKEHYDEQDK